MTLATAIAMLTTPAVYHRIQHLLHQTPDQCDVAAFRASVLVDFAHTPLIQVALQTFWQHYGTVPLDTVIHVPLPDTRDPSSVN